MMWSMHQRTTAMQAAANRRRQNVASTDWTRDRASGQVCRGQGPEGKTGPRDSDHGREVDARSQYGSDRDQQGRGAT